jgi:hypothetical protein
VPARPRQVGSLAYARLNLTRNPFGEASAGERAALAVVEAGPLAEALAGTGNAVQVLGESGRGKTTHLLALRRAHPQAPWVRVDPGVAPRIPDGGPLFLDEAQFLPAWRRRRLYRPRRRSLALGTHVDLRAELEAAGYRVFTVRLDAAPAVERLDEIFRARIEWARRGPGPVPVVPRRTIEELRARAGSDVRAMEGLLYEALQGAQEIGDVEV